MIDTLELFVSYFIKYFSYFLSQIYFFLRDYVNVNQYSFKLINFIHYFASITSFYLDNHITTLFPKEIKLFFNIKKYCESLNSYYK